VRWIRNKKPPTIPFQIPAVKERKLLNPEIPKLDSYHTKAPANYWDNFPSKAIPNKVETKVNIPNMILEIENKKSLMLPHQYARARKA